MSMNPEHFTSAGLTLPLEVFLPAGSGKCAAMLVVHGSFGVLPPYRADMVSFATALAHAGVAAVMPHYLEATPKLKPGPEVMQVIPQNRPVWRQACCDALTQVARDARFDSTRLGILGFSLGANLALSLGMDPPVGIGMKCVVDFFGPTRMLENYWSKLPPTLIHHGTEDHVVDHAESAFLVAQLQGAKKKEGSDYQVELYKGEGHGFKEPALTKSRDATVAFVKKML